MLINLAGIACLEASYHVVLSGNKKNVLMFRLLSNYVVWQMIRDKISFLSSPFREARAHFNERITGVKDIDPRWRTCTGVTNDNMGVPIGSLYVKKFFDQSAIEKVWNLIPVFPVSSDSFNFLVVIINWLISLGRYLLKNCYISSCLFRSHL